MVATPLGIGTISSPRSLHPESWDAPVALTSPRLSPRFRVPLYVPPSSRPDSPPKVPLSPRSGLTCLNHSRTPRVIAAEPLGKHLFDAAIRGDVPSVQELIHLKADVNHRGIKFNNTALHVASSFGQTNMVRALVAGGADVNVIDKFGSTAVHYASRGGHLPIVQLLVAAGAEHAVVNKHGKTPLQLGRGQAHVTSFLEMLSKADDAINRKQIEDQMAQEKAAEAARKEEEAEQLREQMVMAKAAARMQANVRGHLKRKELKAQLTAKELAAGLGAQSREQSAARLQAQVRGRNSRKHRGATDSTDDAVRQMQDWHVAGVGDGILETDRFGRTIGPTAGKTKEELEAEMEERHPWAATRVQAHHRGRKARAKYQDQYAKELAARQKSHAAQAAQADIFDRKHMMAKEQAAVALLEGASAEELNVAVDHVAGEDLARVAGAPAKEPDPAAGEDEAAAALLEGSPAEEAGMVVQQPDPAAGEDEAAAASLEGSPAEEAGMVVQEPDPAAGEDEAAAAPLEGSPAEEAGIVVQPDMA